MLKEDHDNYVDRNDHDRDGKDNDNEDDGEQDDGDDKVDANLAITPLSSLLIFLNSFSASLILNYPTSENWLQWGKSRSFISGFGFTFCALLGSLGWGSPFLKCVGSKYMGIAQIAFDPP